MRNLFLFLRQYSNFLTFLVLQIICITIVFKYNNFHNAVGLTMANNINKGLHEQRAKLDRFLHIQEENDSLLKVNNELLNKSVNSQISLDTSLREIADYIPIDTLGNMKKVIRSVYRPATVLYRTTTDDKQNYIALGRGTLHGIQKDMAVIGAETQGVVGKTVYADDKVAIVMLLTHNKSKIPGKLKAGGEEGVVEWNGESAQHVTLTKIPKTAKVNIGDTVTTSSASTIFPPNLMIGTVAMVKEEKTSGNLSLKVKLKANMYKVDYVHVVENLQQKEINQALKNVNKQLNNQ
jgi:rod shape-determining protein MreC